jgi:hypothetical protein
MIVMRAGRTQPAESSVEGGTPLGVDAWMREHATQLKGGREQKYVTRVSKYLIFLEANMLSC